jgi:FkbM family methyltransferase
MRGMGMGTAEHERALALLEAGDPAQAAEVLHEAVRSAVDPEMVNDLAVLALRAGRRDEAAELLRALVRLHPDHGAAVQNLSAIEPKTTPPAIPAADTDRRARFLQTVADAHSTHLADNVDHLFEPWGRELPDPAGVGERLAEALEILDRCTTLWESLGDAESRELLLRFFAYRALGPAHVRLQLEPQEYRRTVVGLTAQAMRKANVADMAGMPFEWQVHHYDLRELGLPIQVIGPPLPLASTMCFSQYAYRDATVPARPAPNDVAIDAGGCWGDTALWLAHVIGAGGHVHTFEPAPTNRKLLAHNLQLNPALGQRVTVWPNPLGAQSGATAWIGDVLAAGATIQDEQPGSNGQAMVELELLSIDALVSDGRIPRVDFLKVDVEGADLGVLEGAAETIATQRPRLALACYHKPDDLVRIPDFIASLGVEYKWYLQCSTMTDIDTVAFGLPA